MYKLSRGGAVAPATYTYFDGLAPRRRWGRIVVPLLLLLVFAGGGYFVLRPAPAPARLNSDNTETVAPKVLPLKPIKTLTVDGEQPYQDAQLQQFLESWSNAHPGTDWAVVVQGMEHDKRFASTRANSWYVPASVYKLLMTYTLFSQMSREQMSSVKIPVQGGKPQTVEACVEAMLRYSDNPCGEAVGGYLGWWRIEADLHKLGLKNTYVNRKDSMFSTAGDVSTYLQKLYDGSLMSRSDTDYILGLMRSQRLRQGIPAGCQDCVVADKTGDLFNVRHDVGIVQSNGKTYILVVFTSGAPYSQIADLTHQVNQYLTASP